MSISLGLADHRADSSSDVSPAMQQKIISLAELSLYTCLFRKNLVRLKQKFYQRKKLGSSLTRSTLFCEVCYNIILSHII